MIYLYISDKLRIQFYLIEFNSPFFYHCFFHIEIELVSVAQTTGWSGIIDT